MKKTNGKGQGVGTIHCRGKHFNIKVKLLVTKEVFTLKNVSNDMKIKEVKSYAEFATGVPVNVQRLCYLDEGELLDDTDLKSTNVIVSGLFHMKIWNTQEAVIEAAATGDMEMLTQLGVSEDSDFNTPNSNYMGARARKEWLKDRAFLALYVAAHRGNQKMCQKLIRVGANVNGRTPLGRTPLHVAAAAGHGTIVDLLLENGADINAEDADGESALTIASKFGHKGCERHLFQFRWQQRAKEVQPQTEHEMFAHQYYDSTKRVWLSGPEAQFYCTQILPPGEYQGTEFSAPKRKEVKPKTYSAREDTDSQEWDSCKPHQHMPYYGSQYSVDSQSKKSGSVGMMTINEEATVGSRGHPHPRHPPLSAPKGEPFKQKKVATFQEWLTAKDNAEKRAREQRRYELEMQKLAQQDQKPDKKDKQKS